MDYISLKKFINSVRGTSAKVQIIGKSTLGKPIYGVFFEFNSRGRWAIVTAGIHAREHLSCDLVCMQIEDILKAEKLNFNPPKYNICFVPLVNPDGADFVINGIGKLPLALQQKLLQINKSADFTLYKANANGVDLNNNFNANWNTQFTKAHEPASQGFYGFSHTSESETKALVNLTTKLNPFLSISYHLKGEEIYFDFFQNAKNYTRDLKMAQVFSSSNGYSIKPTQQSSSGGYKDWCVGLNISALTIELGDDKFLHPYPKSELKNIYNKNKDLLNCIDKCYNIYKQYN